MPKILVLGPSGKEVEFRLPTSRALRVGRRPALENDAESDAVDLGEIGWESSMSRNHAELLWLGDRLQVARHHAARNPLFYRGEVSDDFVMEVGDHFVIGETSFHLVDDMDQDAAAA